MSSVIQGTVIAIISMLFGSFLSFFISVLSQRKYFREAVDSAIKTHVDTSHQDLNYKFILKQIEQEKEAREKMEVKMNVIEKSLIFIVSKNGGSLSDLGL